jgi:hypothetical protein
VNIQTLPNQSDISNKNNKQRKDIKKTYIKINQKIKTKLKELKRKIKKYTIKNKNLSQLRLFYRLN